MANRKQRKRRAKSFRHEYELVEIDPETGEERPVDVSALKAEKPSRQSRPAEQQKGRRPRRTAREPQPPSWRRVMKRTALFAPLMALFIFWTQSGSEAGVSLAAVLVNTFVLIAFFAPFSYFVDAMAYRFWVKRTSQPPPKSASKR